MNEGRNGENSDRRFPCTLAPDEDLVAEIGANLVPDISSKVDGRGHSLEECGVALNSHLAATTVSGVGQILDPTTGTSRQDREM